jgi:hypothetical protein
MSQTNVVRRFTYAELFPEIDVENAFKACVPVNLPPSTAIAAGTLLGPTSSVGVSAQQQITAPGSSTYTLSGVNPMTGYAWTTSALAFGANDATVALAINAVINGPSGLPSFPALVTVVSLLVTFGGSLANYPVPLMTLATTGSGSPGVANQTTGVFPGTAPVYAGSSGNVVYIARYSVITDTAANITFGSQTGGIENGAIDLSMSVYTRGYFDASKLSILDSNAVTKLGARFISGSLTAGPGSTPAGTIYIP